MKVRSYFCLVIYIDINLIKPIALYGDEFLETCVMNDNVPDDICILSISGFEVSYYPVNSMKMFYLDYRNCNTSVDKSIFRDIPYFSLKFLKPDDFFTIMMVHGNKYPYVNESVYLHYLASNVRGVNLGIADVRGAIELAGYIPPEGDSESNRILFFVYQQTTELELYSLDLTLLSRENFNPMAWANKQPAIRFCGPLAALQMNVY